MKMAYLRDVVTLRLKAEQCVGCGRCLEVCPHGVFALEQGRSRITDRDACMECGACARNCPFDALWVRNGVGCAVGILNAALGRTSVCCGESQACCGGDGKSKDNDLCAPMAGKEDEKMSEQNDSQRDDTEACGPGCSCGTSGSGGRGRWIVGVVILLIAGVLVVRAVVKNNGAENVRAPAAGFAALPSPAQPSTSDAAVKPAGTDAVKEIAALSELNAVARDTVGVFVFVPGKTETMAKVPTAQIQGAARTMEPRLNGGKIGVFTLRTDSQDYEQIARQMAVPGVLAMVKGRGMSATSGDVTEAKLIQAFVAASSSGGCGPASAGCGPSGCK